MCSLASEHMPFSGGDLVMRSMYVTLAQAGSITERLSPRDQAILLDLARVRVLSGAQLTRLHFATLAPESRERTRRRVLARLAEYQLVAMLERTIGGARAGSAGHVYALGIAAQRVLPLLGDGAYTCGPPSRTRAPETPGSLFLAHALSVAEFYVQLREHERAGQLTVAQFATERAAWWPDGRGSVIKPDAYARLRGTNVEDCWWIEVDRATESLPTLKRKLVAYTDFARSGQLGPHDVVPRVLVTVPHDRRLADVRDLVASLPTPGPELILPTLHESAACTMIDILRG
jgi:protein involved in plasmid replication-relaxation